MAEVVLLSAEHFHFFSHRIFLLRGILNLFLQDIDVTGMRLKEILHAGACADRIFAETEFLHHMRFPCLVVVHVFLFDGSQRV